MPELLPQDVFLNNNDIDDESIGEGGPAITFDEDHQVAESNKHHDIDILIHGIIGFVEAISNGGVNLNIDVEHEEKNDLVDDSLYGETFKGISSSFKPVLSFSHDK